MNRVCPYCGYVDQRQPGQHILAVLNDKTRDYYLGGCSCPICNGLWLEYAYRDGRTVNKLVRTMGQEWGAGRDLHGQYQQPSAIISNFEPITGVQHG